MCDDTMLGPVFQRPVELGADVSYSLTKYVGGHSDLIAGAAMGPKDVIKPIKALHAGPLAPSSTPLRWMLGRSLETLALRMERPTPMREVVAQFLPRPRQGGKRSVPFLDARQPGSQGVSEPRCRVQTQYFSFDIRGGERQLLRSSTRCSFSSWRSVSAARNRWPAIRAP